MRQQICQTMVGHSRVGLPTNIPQQRFLGHYATKLSAIIAQQRTFGHYATGNIPDRGY